MKKPSQDAQRQFLGRESFQVMEEKAAGKLAQLYKKHRHRDKERKNTNIWIHQGIVTEDSPIGSRDDVLPFGFTVSKPCFRCKTIEHISSFCEVVCERNRASLKNSPGARKPPTNNQFPENGMEQLFPAQTRDTHSNTRKVSAFCRQQNTNIYGRSTSRRGRFV